ncbi:MAG: MotA/TolQ/ExbB proton channel family protein [bacterium]
MINLGFKAFFMSSPIIMGILLVCSVGVVWFGLERFIYFAANSRFPKSLWKKLIPLVRDGKIQDAISVCSNNDSPYSRIFLAGLEKAHLSRADVEDSMTVQKEEVQELFRKRLGIFGTLSFVSPLLGLLGTVLGIYRAFHDLALAGSGGPTIVAAGVSAALLTTIAGICVAVPAAVIYNYFTFKLRSLIVGINARSQELVIYMFERGKR